LNRGNQKNKKINLPFELKNAYYNNSFGYNQRVSKIDRNLDPILSAYNRTLIILGHSMHSVDAHTPVTDMYCNVVMYTSVGSKLYLNEVYDFFTVISKNNHIPDTCGKHKFRLCQEISANYMFSGDNNLPTGLYLHNRHKNKLEEVWKLNNGENISVSMLKPVLEKTGIKNIILLGCNERVEVLDKEDINNITKIISSKGK